MKKIINILLVLTILISVSGCKSSNETNNSDNEDTTLPKYAITNNGGLENFDLAFLQFTNEESNTIYSPLSIKYALAMLNEGAGGNSKAQLDAILNGYTPNKYTNSENLSLANMFAIKNTLVDNVSDDFKSTLQDKYDADVFIETFESPNVINNWISEKTFNMIENYIDSFDPNTLFLIINALAIDMDWVNKIQADGDNGPFTYSPVHEDFSKWIDTYEKENPPTIVFNNSTVEGTLFTAIANKYDIIKEVGEDEIRRVVKEDLLKMAKENKYVLEDLAYVYGGTSEDEIINNYLNLYIQDISTNYGDYKQSTDFYFYDNDNIKAFAKDLKEYNGSQFQYVAIMPKQEDLKTYVERLTGEEITNIINNLVTPSYDVFEEGYITEVVGKVPTFEFTYDLGLNNCLKELGITDLFDMEKADLTKIVGNELVFIDTSHKSTIEFSNDGIKASAVTIIGGDGATGMYDYLYEVPIKTIDLSFDNPFMFLIRDKKTGDIWFVGTLYEGTKTSITNLYILADAIKIRKEPSLSSAKIGSAKQYESYKPTGNIVQADGYTWYEIEQGGWIADDNGKWISVR